MAAPIPVPTSLGLRVQREEQTESDYIYNLNFCNCNGGDATARAVVRRQGGGFKFEQPKPGFFERLRSLFCCCCSPAALPTEERRRVYREARDEVRERVKQALLAAHGAHPPPEAELEAQVDGILVGADPSWAEKREVGAPLFEDDLSTIDDMGSFASQRVAEAVLSPAARGAAGGSAVPLVEVAERAGPTPVAALLPTLIPFIHDRSGAAFTDENRRQAVTAELGRHGYTFSALYVTMIIERILTLPSTGRVDAATIHFFASLFQVAGSAR